MSRNMKEGSNEAYRVILCRSETGQVDYALSYGPFATLGAAKGIRTREIREWEQWNNYGTSVRSATGVIQRTDSKWVDVDE